MRLMSPEGKEEEEEEEKEATARFVRRGWF